MTDHLGNVRHYFRISLTSPNAGAVMTGAVSANLDYDAFGREVRVSGTTVPATTTTPPVITTPPGLTAGTPFVNALPFHFSSKFTDPESGLNYYGYRYYNPRDGRWLNRDPIGERDGANLYEFVSNASLMKIDILGLKESVPPNNGRVCNKCKNTTVQVLIDGKYSRLLPGECTDPKDRKCYSDVDGVWVNGVFHSVGDGFNSFTTFNACEDDRSGKKTPGARGYGGNDDYDPGNEGEELPLYKNMPATQRPPNPINDPLHFGWGPNGAFGGF
jgi:hypothetical protein